MSETDEKILRQQGDVVTAGTIYVECERCDEKVPVEVTVTAAIDDDGDDVLVSVCQVADTWAHAWTAHGEEPGDGD